MRRRRPPTALLIDLDGTLRRWDPAWPASVEATFGLPAGALLTTAMAWRTVTAAVCGRITHAEWMADVARQLAGVAGGLRRAQAAVAEWQSYRGEVDPVVLQVIRDARAAGRPVGLATNATDQLAADLTLLGLDGEFDAVINSSSVGIHKPAREYFAAACQALRCDAAVTLLVDDSDRSVRGARAAGLSAFRWTGPDGEPYVRAALRI
jgi:putative hydrolase of the HAD superfamily